MDTVTSFLNHAVPKQKFTLIGYLIAIAALTVSFVARIVTLATSSGHTSLDSDSWSIPIITMLIAYGIYIVVCSFLSGVLALCITKTKQSAVSLDAGLPNSNQGVTLNIAKTIVLVLYAYTVYAFCAQYTYINMTVTTLDAISYIGYTYYVVNVVALGSTIATGFSKNLKNSNK
jgi:hypothetical protein